MAEFVFGELPTTPVDLIEEDGVRLIRGGNLDGEKITLAQLVEWAEDVKERNGFRAWSIQAYSHTPNLFEIMFQSILKNKQFHVYVSKALVPEAAKMPVVDEAPVPEAAKTPVVDEAPVPETAEP